MRPSRILVVASALALTSVAFAPAAAQNAMTAHASKFAFDETVDRLTKAIEGKGIKVAARFDHAAGAKTAGLELAPTVVLLFGNPKLGTPLMQADPRAGLDLPMRMLVWQDKAGKVHVGYAPPSALQSRYALEGDGPTKTLETMSGILAGFAKAATGAE
jgi:uncharacterized protein (DUF302 family)